MRTIRCKNCKKLYEYEGPLPEICPECRKEEELQYLHVRELVSNYPGITALEVHEHTGVPFTTIMKFVERGDLQVIHDEGETGSHDLVTWMRNKRIVNEDYRYKKPTEGEPEIKFEDEILMKKVQRRSSLHFHDGSE